MRRHYRSKSTAAFKPLSAVSYIPLLLDAEVVRFFTGESRMALRPRRRSVPTHTDRS